MSIEEMIRAWKSDEDGLEANSPANPVGEILSDEELQEVLGGAPCTVVLSICQDQASPVVSVVTG